jgi:HSP20 family molecular chaperone IbpA
VALPGAVDKEKVQATYKDGVLEVKLAKAKGTEAREIRVEQVK